MNRSNIFFFLGFLIFLPTLYSYVAIWIPAINGPPSNSVNQWFDINEAYLSVSIIGSMFFFFLAFQTINTSPLKRAILCTGTGISTILGTPNIMFLPGENPGWPRIYATFFLEVSVIFMFLTTCFYLYFSVEGKTKWIAKNNQTTITSK